MIGSTTLCREAARLREIASFIVIQVWLVGGTRKKQKNFTIFQELQQIIFLFFP